MDSALPCRFLLMLTLVGCQTGEPEIIVTPRGFTGPVFVVFNQTIGRPAQYAGKFRLYQVPASGVLHTQFSPNEGWTGVPQFYQETVAEVNQLPTRLTLAQVPSDTVVGFVGASGSLKRGPDTEERLSWREFFIGNRGTVERAQAQVDTFNVLRLVK